MRKLLRIACCLLAAGLVLAGAWSQPTPAWSRSEAQKILQDSPWSRRVRFTWTRMDYAGPAPREVQGSAYCTARLFSALPVREAYVRLFQLMGRYDQMPADRRMIFDGNYSSRIDHQNAVIVSVDIESDDAGALQQLSYYFDNWRAEQFLSSVSLNVARLGGLSLEKYTPPDPDGTGAKFFFPRQVDGRAVVSAGDDRFEFDLVVPGTEARIRVSWNPAELVYRGELEY